MTQEYGDSFYKECMNTIFDTEGDGDGEKGAKVINVNSSLEDGNEVSFHR